MTGLPRIKTLVLVKIKTEIWMELLLWCLCGGDGEEAGCTDENENAREHRFKPQKVEAHWFKEGGKENDWTRVTCKY